MNEKQYKQYIIKLLDHIHSIISLKKILDLILYLILKE